QPCEDGFDVHGGSFRWAAAPGVGRRQDGSGGGVAAVDPAGDGCCCLPEGVAGLVLTEGGKPSEGVGGCLQPVGDGIGESCEAAGDLRGGVSEGVGCLLEFDDLGPGGATFDGHAASP